MSLIQIVCVGLVEHITKLPVTLPPTQYTDVQFGCRALTMGTSTSILQHLKADKHFCHRGLKCKIVVGCRERILCNIPNSESRPV